MKLARVKYLLNHSVLFRGGYYQLTGCVIRLSQNGYFYQAELLDQNKNCVLYCALDEVEEVK